MQTIYFLKAFDSHYPLTTWWPLGDHLATTWRPLGDHWAHKLQYESCRICTVYSVQLTYLLLSFFYVFNKLLFTINNIRILDVAHWCYKWISGCYGSQGVRYRAPYGAITYSTAPHLYSVIGIQVALVHTFPGTLALWQASWLLGNWDKWNCIKLKVNKITSNRLVSISNIKGISKAWNMHIAKVCHI